MKKSKVQTCEGDVTWKIPEHKKVVVLYTDYSALISNAEYKIGFYGKWPQFFEKCFNGMFGV